MDREPPVGAELDDLVRRMRGRTLAAARRNSWLRQTPRVLTAALVVALLLAAGVTAASRILSSPPAVAPSVTAGPTGSASPAPSDPAPTNPAFTATPLPQPTIALAGTAVSDAGFAGAYGWRVRPPHYVLETTDDDGLHWTNDPVPDAFAAWLRPPQPRQTGAAVDVGTDGAIVAAHVTKTGDIEVATQQAPGGAWQVQTVASGIDPQSLRGAGTGLVIAQLPGGFVAISMNVQWTANSGENYLFESHDGGASFELLAQPAWVFRQLVFATPELGVAATGPGGILDVTTDGGRTWAIQRAPLGKDAFNQSGAITRLGSEIVIAAFRYSGDTPEQQLMATSDGRTFTRLTQPGREEVLGLAASGSRLVALSGTGLYRSTDGGHHWQKADSSTPIPELNAAQSLAVGPDGRVVAFEELRECVGSKLDGSLSCAQTHENVSIAPGASEWVAER